MPSPVPPLLLADLVELLQPALFFGGIALLTAWFMMRLAKRRGGGGAASEPRLTATERVERFKQEAGVRRDLETLMVEIEEMAKRLGHQLDAKAVRLERLIDEADHRLTRMRHVAERLEAGEPAEDASAFPSPAAPPASPFTAVDPPESAAPADERALAESVYALADEGLAPPEIARRLDEHAGKVELILALRQG